MYTVTGHTLKILFGDLPNIPKSWGHALKTLDDDDVGCLEELPTNKFKNLLGYESAAKYKCDLLGSSVFRVRFNTSSVFALNLCMLECDEDSDFDSDN